MLAVAFGSISFMTYAISFWRRLGDPTFYADPAAPARSSRHGGSLSGATWSAAIGAAIGVIGRGYRHLAAPRRRGASSSTCSR